MRGGSPPWTWHPSKPQGPPEKMKWRQSHYCDRDFLLEYRSWRQYINCMDKKNQADQWRLVWLNGNLDNFQPLVPDPATRVILQPVTPTSTNTTGGLDLRKNSRAARSTIPHREIHKLPSMAAEIGIENLTGMSELEFIHYLVEAGTSPSWFAKNKIHHLSDGLPITWPWEGIKSDDEKKDAQSKTSNDCTCQTKHEGHNGNSKNETRHPHDQRGKRACGMRQPPHRCPERLHMNTNWQIRAAVADSRSFRALKPNPLVPAFLPIQDGIIMPIAESGFNPIVEIRAGLRGGSAPPEDEVQDSQHTGGLETEGGGFEDMYMLISQLEDIQEEDVESDFLTRNRCEREFERGFLLKCRGWIKYMREVDNENKAAWEQYCASGKQAEFVPPREIENLGRVILRLIRNSLLHERRALYISRRGNRATSVKAAAVPEATIQCSPPARPPCRPPEAWPEGQGPCWPETAWAGLGGGGGGLERPPGYAGQSRPCRPVQANAGRSRPMQAGPGQCRPVQANAGRSRPCRPVQAGPGQCRPVQAGPGQCRPVQADAGRSRPMQANAGQSRPV